MGNPYAARGAVRVSNESRGDLETLLARLDLLGASPDELDQVREGWDDLDDDWTLEARAAFVRMSDADLVAAIQGVRDEYRLGTTTEAEEHTQATIRAEDDLAAGDVLSQAIPHVLAWVGDDDARAFAVHDAEARRPEPRKTLMEAVETRAGAWAARGQ